ncbi:hypothetical protein [Bacillus suaedae]|uniref:Replication protein n=1 Tax=Halalkalibacter suaedae TaxID=2822140 RepID=A0A941AR75_9BACI|nr:hypothetical protein [Bacillus suaedae]MBP3953621.1 hypothetical protein [Bacillus suaedae]
MNEPLIPGGYIILSRQIIESSIWDKPPLYLKVWLYLLNRAQYKEFKQLKRGQLFVSIPEIREACSWYVGFRKEKPTKDQIYQIIDWLRKPNEAVDEAKTKATMITTTKATHGLLITIDNYGVYQNPNNYESNDESNNEKEMRATREQRAPNNINKESKEGKKDKKNTTSFFQNEAVHPFFEIYKSVFKEMLGQDHYPVTEKQATRIMSAMDQLEERGVDREDFENVAYEHLSNLPESNNGNILAFIPAIDRHFPF